MFRYLYQSQLTKGTEKQLLTYVINQLSKTEKQKSVVNAFCLPNPEFKALKSDSMDFQKLRTTRNI